MPTEPVPGRWAKIAKLATLILTILAGSAGTTAVMTLAPGCHAPPPQPTPPTPPVPPTPPAPPTPPPVPPIAEAAGLVIIEDTAQASSARGLLLADPKVTGYIFEHRLKHRIVDISTLVQQGGPPAELVPYLERAKGKPMPYLFVLDAKGATLAEKPCPLTPADFLAALGHHAKGEFLEEVIVDGAPRKLGNKIPPVRGPPITAKLYGSTPDTPLIPRSQWKEIDLSAYLPDVKDQDGVGACNAFATVTAVEATRNLHGLSYVRLSPGYLYGNINGGRDDGSMLEDGLAWMTQHGTCEAKTVPELSWRKSAWPAGAAAEAKQYVVLEAYLCPTFDHYASALQSGFFGIEGILWFHNFNVDRDGWLPSRGTGGYGGHALCGYGLAQRNGVWGVRTRNSWGPRWGQGGNCVIPESLFSGPVGGWWAVRATVQTPADWPPRTARLNARPFDWSQWILSKADARPLDPEAAFLAP